MKRYIAFNGSANSGIQTHEKALEWAKKEFGQKPGLTCLHISEVIEVVERVEPVTKTRHYIVAAEDTELASKAA